MQLKDRIIGCVVMLAMLVVCVSSVQAQLVYTWDNATSIDNDWNDGDNWDCPLCGMMDPVFPDSVNHVARFDISSDVNLNVNATVGNLVLETTGDALIAATSPRTLTVRTNSSTTDGKIVVPNGSFLALGANVTVRYRQVQASSEIGDDFELRASSSRILIDLVSGDRVTFGPHGSDFGALVGMDDAASIEIADPGTGNLQEFRSQITIAGGLTIEPDNSTPNGTTRFTNARVSADMASGAVMATGGGTITLAAGLDLLDIVHRGSNRPFWAAVDANSTLQFDTEALGDPDEPDAQLLGDFELDGSNAVLMFNESVATHGGFNQLQGSVMVAADEVFCWDNFDNCIEGM